MFQRSVCLDTKKCQILFERRVCLDTLSQKNIIDTLFINYKVLFNTFLNMVVSLNIFLDYSSGNTLFYIIFNKVCSIFSRYKYISYYYYSIIIFFSEYSAMMYVCIHTLGDDVCMYTYSQIIKQFSMYIYIYFCCRQARTANEVDAGRHRPVCVYTPDRPESLTRGERRPSSARLRVTTRRSIYIYIHIYIYIYIYMVNFFYSLGVVTPYSKPST